MLSSTDIYDNSRLPRDLCGVVAKYFSYSFLPSREELINFQNSIYENKYEHLNTIIISTLKSVNLLEFVTRNKYKITQYTLLDLAKSLHRFYESEIPLIKNIPIIKELYRLKYNIYFNVIFCQVVFSIT